MAGRISYYGNIVRDNLILDLDAGKLDSYPGSGTLWRDITWNNRNGTLTNFGPSSFYSRDNGGYLIFGGTNDYVDLGTLPNLNGLTNFTAECWFYNYSTSTSYQSVISQFNGTNGWSIQTSTNTNYKIIVSMGTSTAFGGVNDTPTNSWIHVALLYDGNLVGNTNRLKMSINGVIRSFDNYNGGTVPSTLPNVTSVNCNIGALLPTFGRYFNGLIPMVRLYNKTLSSSEVLQNYNATKGRYQ